MKKIIAILALLLVSTVQVQAKVNVSKCLASNSSDANIICNASSEFYKKFDMSYVRIISSDWRPSLGGYTVADHFYSTLKWHDKDLDTNVILLRAILVPDYTATKITAFRFLYIRAQDVKGK